MQPIAASVLMKILYMARMALYDLLRATCKLATMVTRWDESCNAKLHRLVSYTICTATYRLVGCIGDSVDKLGPCLWTGADLGGCGQTSRSSSGIHMAVRGPHSCVPLNSIYKRQSCVSTATTEAEFLAAASGNRNELLPAVD